MNRQIKTHNILYLNYLEFVSILSVFLFLNMCMYIYIHRLDETDGLLDALDGYWVTTIYSMLLPISLIFLLYVMLLYSFIHKK